MCVYLCVCAGECRDSLWLGARRCPRPAGRSCSASGLQRAQCKHRCGASNCRSLWRQPGRRARRKADEDDASVVCRCTWTTARGSGRSARSRRGGTSLCAVRVLSGFAAVVSLCVFWCRDHPGSPRWSPARFPNGPRQRVVCFTMRFGDGTHAYNTSKSKYVSGNGSSINVKCHHS